MAIKVNRRAKIGLAVVVLALGYVACRQIPDGTLGGGSGGDEEKYADHVLMARDAFERQPRSIADVEEAASHYDQALAIRTDDYETLWLAARTSAWLGEYGADKALRERHVKQGITYANTALKLDDKRVEARFFHGVLSGLLGDLDNSYGMDAVKQIESRMTALIDEGADFANSGPQRVYGVLLLRAPGPPTSIGSLRNARKQLEAAVEKHPDWPENQLYLAEWEFAWGKDRGNPEFKTRARERLEKSLLGPDARPPAGIGHEWQVWQQKARKLLADHS